MSNNLLDCRSITKDTVERIMKKAANYKNDFINKRLLPELSGKTVFMLFLEPSTRTRCSFEMAIKRLGMIPINIYGSFSSITKGETLEDTILNLSKMHPSAFVIRHQDSGICCRLLDITDIPIINAGDGTHAHPSQALLDLFTILEKKGTAKGLNVSIIGDILSSRVAKSDSELLTKMGCSVTLFGPATMLPEHSYMPNVKIAGSMKEAMSEKDVIILLRIQLERNSGGNIFSLNEYHKHFGINQKMIEEKTIIMHPGPFNRGVELSSDILKLDNIEIFNQVENGVFVRMAIFWWIISGSHKKE